MSEIEMSNLRAALHPSPELTDNSGDSSTVQDRLLSGNHHHVNYHPLHNGHTTLPSPPPYQQKNGQHGFNDLGMPRPRPVTGSGVVFRRRRKPCWCVLLVLVAVALMATGISLGVLFGVVTQEEDVGQPGQTGSNDTAHPTSTTTRLDNIDDDDDGKDDSSMTDRFPLPNAPPSATPQQPPPPPGRTGSGGGTVLDGGADWAVSVRRFKAYWHPGDSRVLEVLLSNGTVLQAAGHKANNGTFLGLYSLSLTQTQGRTTRVRFMGGRNLASVILPDGTVVNLDWSANNADVECKVFQIPPPKGAPGSGPGGMDSLTSPTSHLAMLQPGVHSLTLRQISRALDDASASPGTLDDEDYDVREGTEGGKPTPFCAPRLPVKVTKCGGQYPYDGAFVQGDVTTQSGPQINVAALPWRRQDDDDDCYSQFRGVSPNFFIPLPGHMDTATARYTAERFWKTGARWWERVCGVVGAVLEVDVQRHQVCANMAASAQTQITDRDLYSVVYDSCAALLSSLHLTCRTLDELIASAAAPASRSGTPYSNGNSASAGMGSVATRQPLKQELLKRVLASASSLQEPATTPYQEVHIKTSAFCPSLQPRTSYDKAITLQTSDGGVASRTVTEADLVHVNCEGGPEVTLFYLGHAAAVDRLDMVKHRLKVCAVCAFETTFSVHVQRDHMCCNDTCTRQLRCEDSISEARMGLGLSESHTFTSQNSVYCHDFLTAADTPTRALDRSCMGSCQSNLEVKFQIKDAYREGGRAGDGGRVYLDQVLSCLEGFQDKCKSTFGH